MRLARGPFFPPCADDSVQHASCTHGPRTRGEGVRYRRTLVHHEQDRTERYVRHSQVVQFHHNHRIPSHIDAAAAFFETDFVVGCDAVRPLAQDVARARGPPPQRPLRLSEVAPAPCAVVLGEVPACSPYVNGVSRLCCIWEIRRRPASSRAVDGRREAHCAHEPWKHRRACAVGQAPELGIHQAHAYGWRTLDHIYP